MFNLFFEYSNIIKPIETVNVVLIMTNEWFTTNKLSLNVGKAKFALFRQNIKHHFSSTKVKNKQSRY